VFQDFSGRRKDAVEIAKEDELNVQLENVTELLQSREKN
jgi:hypothetical protein